MRRSEKPGNLYKVMKAQRPDQKIVDSQLHFMLHPDLRTHSRVLIKKFKRENFKRGLQAKHGETPYPVSPKIGPYEIKDPLFGAKNYYWCSCGMSSKQPFCDSSHVGTEFKPIKFSLDEPQKVIFICGCKLSHKAPFCDGQTCINMMMDANKELKTKEQAVEAMVGGVETGKSSAEEQQKSL